MFVEKRLKYVGKLPDINHQSILFGDRMLKQHQAKLDSSLEARNTSVNCVYLTN